MGLHLIYRPSEMEKRRFTYLHRGEFFRRAGACAYFVCFGHGECGRSGVVPPLCLFAWEGKMEVGEEGGTTSYEKDRLLRLVSLLICATLGGETGQHIEEYVPYSTIFLAQVQHFNLPPSPINLHFPPYHSKPSLSTEDLSRKRRFAQVKHFTSPLSPTNIISLSTTLYLSADYQSLSSN